MDSTKAQLILHPVRMQILQMLIGGRQLTPLQLAKALPDVPQASLYRHIGKLAQAGILVVVEERPVRGTVERVYALPDTAAHLTQAEVAHASPEEHMRYFTTFVATLLGDFARYLQRDSLDLERDGVGYHQIALNLTEDELSELGVALNAALKPFLEKQPSPERQRRMFSTIIMPADYSHHDEGPES